MKHSLWILITALLLATGSVFAGDADLLIRRANRFFEPLPEAMPGSENDSVERIALGKKLYFEKRLSVNHKQSCESCHRLEDGFAGVDNLPTSPGARCEQGTRNSPTVLYTLGIQNVEMFAIGEGRKCVGEQILQRYTRVDHLCAAFRQVVHGLAEQAGQHIPLQSYGVLEI